MPITTAYSQRELPEAVRELKSQCGSSKPRVVIYFASTRYEPTALSGAMQAAFPGSCLFGCSTAGEFAAAQMLTGSVVAMFLNDDIVTEADTAIVDLSAPGGVRDAFTRLAAHFPQPLSIERNIGIVLIDGLSGAEEKVMETLGDLTDVFFIGGSAGDDVQFRSTHVMAGAKAYTNSAVLAMLRVPKGFDILKTQSFRPAGKTLIATEVDEPSRKVLKFNGTPALEAYAEAIGTSTADAESRFMLHPLGLMVDGEPYVRSPQRTECGAMYFYCNIKEGMELEVLTATDIVAGTRTALETKKAELGHIGGLIDFNCILRTLQLREEKRCEDYGSVLRGIPAIGFSTYGEEYLGHINQTSTMLLFR